jgi:hypothetical protein
MATTGTHAFVSLIVCALALLWLPSQTLAGGAGKEEVTFQEGLAADNAALTNQYEAADGIQFDTPTPTGDSLGFHGTLPMNECGAQLLTNGFYKPGSPPVVILASRSGGDEGCRDSSEFFGPRQGMLFHLDDARGSLSFQMRAFTAQANQLSAITGAIAVAYRSDGTVLDEERLDASEAREWSTVTLSSADPAGIQFIAVYAEIDIGAAVGVQMDNLMLPEAIATSQPAFRVVASEQGDTGDLVEGDTLDIPVQVVRENGSKGAITVNAHTGQPSAFSRVVVNQSPGGEPPGTALVELTAEPGQAGRNAVVTVDGTGGGEAGAQDDPALEYEFTIQPDLVIVAPSTSRVAPGCVAPGGLQLQVAGKTPIHVQLEVSNDFFENLEVAGPEELQIPDTILAEYPGLTQTVPIRIVATPSGTSESLPPFSTQSFTSTLERPTPTVNLTSGTFYASAVQTRAFPGASTNVSFNATGLPCHELALQVGEDRAKSGVFTPTGPGVANVSIPVPNAATPATLSNFPTPMSIVDESQGGSQVLDIPGVKLGDFRSAFGMHFENLVTTSLEWSDIERTFGPSVNDCSPVDCWHDPISEGIFKWIQGPLPSGLCFGYTMLASQLFRDETSASAFGAPSVGGLAIPVKGKIRLAKVANYPTLDDTKALGQQLVSGWLSQFDAHYDMLESDEVGRFKTMSSFVTALTNALATEGIAIINILEPEAGEGHSLVAYAIEPIAGGTYGVDVYNPDVGYADPLTLGEPLGAQAWAGEETKLSEHSEGLSKSQIKLTPPGPEASLNEWVLTGPPGWGGSVEDIGLTTLKQRPLKPELLNLGNIAGFGATSLQVFLSGTGGSSGATPSPVGISQISGGGKAQLGAHGIPLKGSNVHVLLPSDGAGGSAGASAYVLPAGKTYDVQTDATSSGHFQMLGFGSGIGAGVEDAGVDPGEHDDLTLHPGRAAISFKSSGETPATLELVGGHNRADGRTAMLSLGSADGTTTASLAGGGELSLHHAGAATVLSVALFARGSAIGTGKIIVPAGASLTLKPNWSTLATGAVAGTLDGKPVRLSFTTAHGGPLSKMLHVTDRHKKKKKKKKKKRSS